MKVCEAGGPRCPAGGADTVLGQARAVDGDAVPGPRWGAGGAGGERGESRMPSVSTPVKRN